MSPHCWSLATDSQHLQLAKRKPRVREGQKIRAYFQALIVVLVACLSLAIPVCLVQLQVYHNEVSQSRQGK